MQSLYLWLWRLLPANPLAVRIVQGRSRLGRDLWMRMLYLGAMIAIVMFGLIAAGGLANNVTLDRMAQAGTRVFALVAYTQVSLICLLAPLFMAGALGEQQAGRTYNILLTTPLTNLQIVLGSLMGRLFLVWVLLASGLPLFSVLLIFGGVPIQSVFVAFAVAGLVALVVGAMAVALSVMRAGGRRAVFIFVVVVAGYLVGTYMLDVLLLRDPLVRQSTWLTPLHPLLVLETFVRRTNYRPPEIATLGEYPWLARYYLAKPLATFTILCLGTSALLVGLSTVYVRRMVQFEGTSHWLGRLLRFSSPQGRERRRPPRAVKGNPIAWREANTRGNRAGLVFARFGFTAVGLILAGGMLLAYHLGAMTAGQLRSSLVTLVWVQIAVIVLVAVYMSAGAVSAEREDGTLDLLLTTPITPKQYLWGKLRGLVNFLALMLASPILALGLVAVYANLGAMLGWSSASMTDPILRSANPVHHELMLLEAPLLLAMMLVPFVALCLMVGLNWSLKAKTVMGAIVPTIAILGTAVAVLGLCGSQAAMNVPLVGPIFNSFSPATNLMMVVNPWSTVAGFADSAVMGRVALFLAGLSCAGVYALIVYSMLLGMTRDFDRTVRKLTGTA